MKKIMKKKGVKVWNFRGFIFCFLLFAFILVCFPDPQKGEVEAVYYDKPILEYALLHDPVATSTPTPTATLMPTATRVYRLTKWEWDEVG